MTLIPTYKSIYIIPLIKSQEFKNISPLKRYIVIYPEDSPRIKIKATLLTHIILQTQPTR